MKPKKILILCQYFYPEYVSSATLPTQMAEDLVDKGLDIDVMCGWPYEYTQAHEVKAKETYRHISITRLKYSRLNNKSKIGRIVNFFSLFLMFVLKMPKMLKYDHILVYSNPPILPLIPDILYRVFKKRYTFVVYDIAPDNAIKTGATRRGSVIDKLMTYINKHVYQNASQVVVLGTEMKRYLIENGISQKPETIKVIPNWYDETQINHQRIQNPEFKALRDQYQKVILYSGNMGQLQDMDTILNMTKAIKDNPDILTIFCGHGKKFAQVEAFIQKHQLKHVKLYEFLTGTDYSDVLTMADVCIVSLVKEGIGLGVPSKNYGYLAAKKPLIAIMDKQTDIVSHITDYDAGIAVANGDYESIKAFIENNSVEALRTKGNHAYQLFKQFYTRDINTEKYYQLLK
ncbi:glycosyltransferase family 4 protein [Staphylococcus canis]|uniref:Glycosyltransferase family 4 protein n=1 Tax=Staphylococcus canis TaxID=2724942 RepID=A0ABS0TA15_9STAP|nr:glycosyltransferase family 4 protein [Staphylococcus canis]MBI5975584.1 glycosyltransferase family 4 protein [Staphylococcus canis]